MISIPPVEVRPDLLRADEVYVVLADELAELAVLSREHAGLAEVVHQARQPLLQLVVHALALGVALQGGADAHVRRCSPVTVDEELPVARSAGSVHSKGVLLMLQSRAAL